MYRGFQVKLCQSAQIFGREFGNYLQAGSTLLKKHKTKVKKILDNFLLSDGSIDGSKMQENWFPQIKADIFISHSHKDEKLAIALAGWLHKNFRLVSFIDSCVWGYSNDLLRMIDNRYCYQKATNTYSYRKRNYSTSHIHMMLSVALNQMIDNTECLFFLNTPNSISLDAPIDGTTSSPWIYSEIAISRLIRKKCPRKRLSRLNESQKAFSRKLVRYRLPMDHLPIISSVDLSRWEQSYNNPRSSNYPPTPHALDTLYQLTDKKHER